MQGSNSKDSSFSMYSPFLANTAPCFNNSCDPIDKGEWIHPGTAKTPLYLKDKTLASKTACGDSKTFNAL
ncbi:MAG: hypothetical protein AAEF72_04585 [Gammaproteobacteria bacterium]